MNAPRRIVPLLSLVIALAALTGAASAQIRSEPPVVEANNALVLDAIGHKFSLPLPDWLSADELQTGNVAPLVQMTYRSDDGQALLEVYPQGEIQALWKTLYGAQISLGTNRTLADHRRLVILGYSQTCKPELTAFFQLGQDKGDDLAPLGFVCGGYRDTLQGYAGEGEVMVMAFRKTAKGLGTVYQEWRGPAFNPTQPDTWPVTTAVVEARARQLQSDTTLTLAD